MRGTWRLRCLSRMSRDIVLQQDKYNLLMNGMQKLLMTQLHACAVGVSYLLDDNLGT